MGLIRITVYLATIFVQYFLATAVTNNRDYIALHALKDVWKSTPPNWVGQDPCGSNWDGIHCTSGRVTSINLASMGIIGQLSGDIQHLSELDTLDLSYNPDLTGPLLPAIASLQNLKILYLSRCGFSGSIPDSIGSLQKLEILNLIGCSFSGTIPDSIGSLQKLEILSLNSNSFTGRIPASIGNLSNLYWLDLADNRLFGAIPISNKTTLGLDLLVNAKHFHFGNNKLSGKLPPRLFSSKMTLIHLLLESNQFSGEIPSTLGLVKTLEVLRLDRNSFTGPVPAGLSNLNHINALFLSNNQLSGPLPDFTGMSSLQYLDIGNNYFDPSDFPSWMLDFQSVTTLLMQNTRLQGQVPVALFALTKLQTVKLGDNHLNGTLDIGSSFSNELKVIDLRNNSIVALAERGELEIALLLVGNPICDRSVNIKSFCKVQQSKVPYSTPLKNCMRPTCKPEQVSSPNCKCAYPYTGTLIFRASTISDFESSTVYTYLENSLMSSFKTHQLPVDSVSLSYSSTDANSYLLLNLEIFPSGQDWFNRTGISETMSVLRYERFKSPTFFGPYSFNGSSYNNFTGIVKETKSRNTGLLVGAAVGGSVLLVLFILAGLYALHLKRRAEKADNLNNPFADWDQNEGHGGVPQLKGTTFFSFGDVKKYTNNFSEANSVGSGGYGKKQRGHGLGAARGLQYLHELADPPIIHRDIKSNNILLDENMTAKVADFGLSKPMSDSERRHITTQVKGTMGYLDPEYYMTQQLTEKSDVYSFGIVMLEVITARQPIEKGKHIVREIRQIIDKTQGLYNLHELLDPALSGNKLIGLENFVDLAMSCVEEAGEKRPSMGTVVKEIENIMQIAGLNPNADSASTSATYEGDSKGIEHPYSESKGLFVYNGAFPTAKIEPL